MPRRPRFVMPEVPHHITQRGNNRQDVFFSDDDRARYMDILKVHCDRHNLRLLGWCLMTNHVHLIAIPASSESIALTLGQSHAQYSLEFNRTYNREGHLWYNRFFSCPLDSRHLLAALLYVDLNPVRAAMVDEALQWQWSSARTHAGYGEDPWIDSDWLVWLDQARIGWDFEGWREEIAGGLSTDVMDRLRRGTRLGEPCGDESFLLNLEYHAGRRLRVLGKGRPARVAAAGKCV